MHKPLKLYHHMTFGNRENMVSYFLTVFENHRKSIIQHCERSELRLHFEWTKVNQKFQKMFSLAIFWKPAQVHSVTRQVNFKGQKNGGKIQMRHFGVIFGRTVIPDRSFKIGQKMAENAII